MGLDNVHSPNNPEHHIKIVEVYGILTTHITIIHSYPSIKPTYRYTKENKYTK
jgi:hypothetical protein